MSLYHYQIGKLVFCNRCTPLVRESLKESLIIPRYLPALGRTCDIMCNYHIEGAYDINGLMMKFTDKGLRLTNDSRRTLLKKLRNLRTTFSDLNIRNTNVKCLNLNFTVYQSYILNIFPYLISCS